MRFTRFARAGLARGTCRSPDRQRHRRRGLHLLRSRSANGARAVPGRRRGVGRGHRQHGHRSSPPPNATNEQARALPADPRRGRLRKFDGLPDRRHLARPSSASTSSTTGSPRSGRRRRRPLRGHRREQHRRRRAEGDALGSPTPASSYYRSDLLEKYGRDVPRERGPNSRRPPGSSVEGERARGEPAHVGPRPSQGRAYEGLTVQRPRVDRFLGAAAPSWTRAGRNHRRQPRRRGRPSTPAAGLDRHHRPRGRPQLLRGGGAAASSSRATPSFMRNWPYAWALANSAGAPSRAEGRRSANAGRPAAGGRPQDRRPRRLAARRLALLGVARGRRRPRALPHLARGAEAPRHRGLLQPHHPRPLRGSGGPRGGPLLRQPLRHVRQRRRPPVEGDRREVQPRLQRLLERRPHAPVGREDAETALAAFGGEPPRFSRPGWVHPHRRGGRRAGGLPWSSGKGAPARQASSRAAGYRAALRLFLAPIWFRSPRWRAGRSVRDSSSPTGRPLTRHRGFILRASTTLERWWAAPIALPVERVWKRQICRITLVLGSSLETVSALVVDALALNRAAFPCAASLPYPPTAVDIYPPFEARLSTLRAAAILVD